MIRLEAVSYTYPAATAPALADVTMEIKAGQVLGLVGPNGAGKSTLCAALAGLIPHHYRGTLTGRVLVDGLDTRRTPLTQIVTRVGIVMQNPFNQMSGTKETVEEEVAFGLENLGIPRAEMQVRVRESLAQVGMEAARERSPYALSGGEMQRVALAAILVMQPEILVLDEPTSQLDPEGTKELYAILAAIAERRRATIVLAEQKTEWLAQLAGRVIALDHGRIVLDGLTRDVLTSPRLVELGVPVSRYTTVARQARERGAWAADLSLPITLEQVVEGFRTKHT